MSHNNSTAPGGVKSPRKTRPTAAKIVPKTYLRHALGCPKGKNPSGATTRMRDVRATLDNEKWPNPQPPRWCRTPEGIILVPCSVLGTTKNPSKHLFLGHKAPTKTANAHFLDGAQGPHQERRQTPKSSLCLPLVSGPPLNNMEWKAKVMHQHLQLWIQSYERSPLG